VPGPALREIPVNSPRAEARSIRHARCSTPSARQLRRDQIREHTMATKKTVKDIAPKKTTAVKGGRPRNTNI